VDTVFGYNPSFCFSRQCHARKNTPRLTLISFYTVVG
jgi:hypothetical protein